VFQSFLFKAEIINLSERGFIRLFEKKWHEGDLFAVNFMLACAEEESALTSIKKYEAEIKALENFLKKNEGDE